MNNLQKIIKELGFSEIGRECGVSRQAVHQWFVAGKLPKTENKHDRSKTQYALIIANMASVSKEFLLKV